MRFCATADCKIRLRIITALHEHTEDEEPEQPSENESGDKLHGSHLLSAKNRISAHDLLHLRVQNRLLA
jgi:hypothetical protein